MRPKREGKRAAALRSTRTWCHLPESPAFSRRGLPGLEASFGSDEAGAQFHPTFPEKWLALTFGEDAGVAQLAEQLLCKRVVCL